MDTDDLIKKSPREMTALELLEVYEMWFLSRHASLMCVWSDHPEYRPMFNFPVDMSEVRKRFVELKREALDASAPEECEFDHSNHAPLKPNLT